MRAQPLGERYCIVLCLLAWLSAVPQAQSRTADGHVDVAAGQSAGGSDDQNTFRVNVRLVNVFTTVTDEHGATIYDLTKNDFRIFEDGVPQTISVFERQSELPLSVVLGIDTSESTRRDLKLEMASAKKFVRSILRPQDRLSIFQISENTDQLTGFSADMKYLEHGIDNLHAGAGTSLYDAIFLGSEALLKKQGRKVIVLITDGGDTTSQTDYANALRRAQEAEAIIYSIIIVPVAADAGRNLGGEHALIQLSKDTGGKYYYAESINQLDQAFQQVSEELRSQYLIAYYPNRRFSDSSFRRIQIELIGHAPQATSWQVRHRAGYFTAPVH
ncbi:MAG TPA: VWA domain-containing protein [Candidatus Angelobacter sp.]|nr:VWA domain-containing protein [Candidatus Angelobacter sp.]